MIFDRDELLDNLRRDREQLLADIEAREAALEADPIAENDRIRAEAAQMASRSPLVRRAGPGGQMIYKEKRNALVSPAAPARAHPDDDGWNERLLSDGEMLDVVGTALGIADGEHAEQLKKLARRLQKKIDALESRINELENARAANVHDLRKPHHAT